jgi:hypothetical protein
MSTLIADVVNDAAIEIGDPNKQRVQMLQWHSFYNSSNREMGERADVFRFLDEFDLVADQPRYEYPPGMTSMAGLRVSETPSDQTTFRVVKQMFEDEWRNSTDAIYPKGTLPSHYFPTTGWFWVVPMAEATIVKGGCLDYFGIPDSVTYDYFTNPSSVIQAPDFARDYLRRRIVIYGMAARNRLVEAKTAYEMWEADMQGFQDRLQRRSKDRRSSFAPRKNRYAGMR